MSNATLAQASALPPAWGYHHAQVSSRNSVQRAFDAFGKAHFQAKESGTWHREIEGILQSFNLQKSQYRLSYYLNVKLDLTGAVPVELAEDERDLGVRFYIEGRAEGLMPDASGKTLLDLLNIDGTTTTDEHREHQLLDLLREAARTDIGRPLLARRNQGLLRPKRVPSLPRKSLCQARPRRSPAGERLAHVHLDAPLFGRHCATLAQPTALAPLKSARRRSSAPGRVSKSHLALRSLGRDTSWHGPGVAQLVEQPTVHWTDAGSNPAPGGPGHSKARRKAGLRVTQPEPTVQPQNSSHRQASFVKTRAGQVTDARRCLA